MKLLYLTEDYLYSKVHNNLLNCLLEKDPSLIVYVFAPARKGQDRSRSLEGSFKYNERLIEVILQVDIPVMLYKIDFWAKLRCKVRLIEKNIPIREIDAIHAATLYAEGGTARMLQKKYGIPFFTTVRGTDVMFYARKMPHLWLTGINVMRHANALACVTPSIKKKMLERWQHAGIRDVIENADIVNNGIDNIWLEHKYIKPKLLGTPVRILYIGRFDANKNVLRLVEAVKRLRDKFDVRLLLIGGKGDEHDEVVKRVKDSPDYLEYLGPIYDKNELMKIVRECDIFAMVSHSETFGLVYAECLSQGLPILYTRGTGFDGMYDEGVVGFSADSYSVDSIIEGLEKIENNYQTLKENIAKLDFSRFSWDNTTAKYLQYYATIKSQKGDMGGGKNT